MINDIALTIGLIWAMGVLLCNYVLPWKKGEYAIILLFTIIVNVVATAIFFAAYGISYLIAIGLN